jgi:hypothetical protein
MGLISMHGPHEFDMKSSNTPWGAAPAVATEIKSSGIAVMVWDSRARSNGTPE